MQDTHPDWAPSLLLGHNDVKAPDGKRFERQSRRTRKKMPAERAAEEEMEMVQVVENEIVQEEVVIKQEADDHSCEDPDDHSAGGYISYKTLHVEINRLVEVNKSRQNEIKRLLELNRTSQDEIHHLLEENGKLKHELDEHKMTKAMSKASHDEINRLLEENRQLKHDLDEHKMTEQFLKDDDEKVNYYTGLTSYATFQVLLCYILPFLPQGKRKLTPFQMILLTFMRLRLDLPVQHISHMFRVHRATVAAAFQDTVSVLYSRWSPLVCGPDRECLRDSMPHQIVETFGNRFFLVPSREREGRRRNLWLQAIRRKTPRGKRLDPDSVYVCGKHFITGVPVKNPQHPDNIPSIVPRRRRTEGAEKIRRYYNARKREAVRRYYDARKREEDRNKQMVERMPPPVPPLDPTLVLTDHSYAEGAASQVNEDDPPSQQNEQDTHSQENEWDYSSQDNEQDSHTHTPRTMNRTHIHTQDNEQDSHTQENEEDSPSQENAAAVVAMEMANLSRETM